MSKPKWMTQRREKDLDPEYYIVDEAMMGQEWNPPEDVHEANDRLREFVEILNEEIEKTGVNVEAEACFNAYNCAPMSQSDEVLPHRVWEKALDRTPDDWWR